ncbi:MAG: hypothetical protein EA402_04905 [Planctomycetota bacterium]|nr:MAG: hypothetical protein EA402_04905 [Planctomycetota bacterium]
MNPLYQLRRENGRAKEWGSEHVQGENPTPTMFFYATSFSLLALKASSILHNSLHSSFLSRVLELRGDDLRKPQKKAQVNRPRVDNALGKGLLG